MKILPNFYWTERNKSPTVFVRVDRVVLGAVFYSRLSEKAKNIIRYRSDENTFLQNNELVKGWFLNLLMKFLWWAQDRMERTDDSDDDPGMGAGKYA